MFQKRDRLERKMKPTVQLYVFELKVTIGTFSTKSFPRHLLRVKWQRLEAEANKLWDNYIF